MTTHINTAIHVYNTGHCWQLDVVLLETTGMLAVVKSVGKICKKHY